MKIPKIVIADCDDWKALYVDGELIKQDHDIDAEDVLDALGIDYKRLEVNGDWLMDEASGDFPDSVVDVKFNDKVTFEKPKKRKKPSDEKGNRPI